MGVAVSVCVGVRVGVGEEVADGTTVAVGRGVEVAVGVGVGFKPAKALQAEAVEIAKPDNNMQTLLKFTFNLPQEIVAGYSGKE